MADPTGLNAYYLAAAVLGVGGLYVWWLRGEKHDLAARLEQWRSDAIEAHSECVVERAKNRRLRHLLSVTGFAPPRDGDDWPDPDPDPRPVYGPPLPVPDAPAWCYEPVDADPEGEIVGGVFHLDNRLVNTSKVILPWLETAS